MIGCPKFSALCVFALSAIAFADDFELPVLPETKPVQQALPQDSAGQKQTNDESDYGAPVNFTPIEATSVSETHNASANLPSGVIAKKIPENLNRPLKVGVYIGVKELYLKLEGETIHMTPSGNMVKFQGKENSVTLENKEIYGEGNCISIAPTAKELASACYPGHFYVSASKGLINAVNVVDVEEYLRGVVPYEIGKLDSSRFSALESQAIAARTYAYKHFGSRESMGFDVYADTKDQVYMGLRSATPLTDSAVKSTAGIVMTYNGEFIIAYYHSTCGGMSETLATWERPDLPYLKSAPDLRDDGTPWCNESSYSKWERKFSDKELESLIKKNGKEAKAKVPDFKKIKNIVVKDTLNSGRILTLAVETDKGKFEVRGDKVRWLFKKGGTILPSSFFRIEHKKGEWTVSGKGFGHGVGMCQMGVRARSAAGQDFKTILTHYYPGITLERFEK
ncbi:SpoIID/LytB domain-containing protein [uncultured Fibrobacter sp.]|uniref:SpoIID/LytB domain-containing protein n=1 Tax=uncultured Fibrobacter sp. TaxID=261512 RepID=UPI0025E9E8BD|nr:SpoIID/LytB domain-containing protein [uncultured Fibrobacter sp.]